MKQSNPRNYLIDFYTEPLTDESVQVYNDDGFYVEFVYITPAKMASGIIFHEKKATISHQRYIRVKEEFFLLTLELKTELKDLGLSS